MTADRPQSHEVQPTSMTLRDALVDSTFKVGRVLPRPVTSLELGILGPEADALMQMTLRHPKKLEHGKMLFVSPQHTLLIPTKAQEGLEGGEVDLRKNIPLNTARRSNRKEDRQDRFAAAAMHTHEDLDFPPSPEDLWGLFLQDDNPVAETAVFVITKSKRPDGSIAANKYIVFRGENTPQLSVKEIDEKIEKWTEMLEERILSNLKPLMSEEEQLAINARAQAAWLRSMVRNYDLRLFTAVNGSSKAVLATA